MNKLDVKDNEFPFDKLAQLGLTREMIEDLPTQVLEDLYDGYRTPVLPVMVQDEEGNAIKSRARFCLVRMEDASLDVVFFPELLEADLHEFDSQQQDDLKAGRVILAKVTNQEGNKVESFVQLDQETNQVISASTQVVGRNIQLISSHLQLTLTETDSLQKGDVVTFVPEEEEPISMGIDLNDRTGLRLTPGDAKKWTEKGKREWDKYTFGLYGCWMMDDEGNLDYVSEEDYTDELWNELKKHGGQKR